MTALTIGATERQWDLLRWLCFMAMLGFVFIEPNPTSRTWSADGGIGTVEGSLFQQLLWPVILLFVITCVAGRWKAVYNQFDVTFFLFMSWALLTTFFAISPAVSIRRYVFMLLVVVTVLIAVSSISDQRQIWRALFLCFAITTVYALFYAIAIPRFGLHQATGQEPHLAGLWRGQFAHKNVAAPLFALMILTIWRLRSRVSWLYCYSLLPLQVVFLWFAGGKTAAYLTIPVFLLTEFITRSRNVIAICSAVVIPLAIANFITIGSVANDSAKYLASKIVGDASFTGRTEIWQVLLYFTSLNPITGAGFQSFWQLNTDSPALRYGGSWLNTAFYGHQGYLDLAATVGIPGVILALGFVLWRPLKDICAIRDRANPLFAACVSIWLMPLFLGITESNLFDKADPSWVMMLIGIAFLRRMVIEEGQSGNYVVPQQVLPQFTDHDLRATDHYLRLLAASSVRTGPQAALEDRSQDPPSGN
jgi:O-antigen ligase